MALRDPYDNSAFLRVGELAEGIHVEVEERDAIETDGVPELGPVPTIPAGWPSLRAEALHGIAGDLVRAIGPKTESDPVGLLVQFLACVGNAVGRCPYFEVEADRHHGNINLVLVGKTSSGKGMSFNHVRRIFRHADVDPDWARGNITGNLSSGEGLIHAVRDPVYKDEPGKDGESVTRVCTDQGVSDKRLFVYEPEFSSPLVVSQRPGNTLSGIVRQAWETGDLSNTNKNSPERATDAHITIDGHITFSEIRQLVDSIGSANGLANRFLWVCVKSSKDLPFGGSLSEIDLHPLYSRLGRTLASARGISAMHRDDKANALWAEAYAGLKEQPDDMVGSICGRARPQVVRLSLLYALLDDSRVIREDHLLAALALWDYCADSARIIFGDASGDPVADKILAAIRSVAPNGLSRTEINDLLGGHQPKTRIDGALRLLTESRKITAQSLPKGGARYFAC